MTHLLASSVIYDGGHIFEWIRPRRNSVRDDRARDPNLADMADFTAGRRIHLCDFSNSIFGKNNAG